MPIDFFFSSLAEVQKSRSIGVVLSGAAFDGTIGLEAIKAAGGITFAQDASAKFDFVLPPAAIAQGLAGIAEHFHFGAAPGITAVKNGPALQQILSLLQSRNGVNFTHYKLPTILRGLSRRMALHHLDKLEDYLDLLKQRPAEADALFDDLLITVTEFFRDPVAFEALAEKAFPVILRDREPDVPIRAWVSPGLRKLLPTCR